MLTRVFFYPALFILCWLYATKFSNIDYDLMARLAVGKAFTQTGNILPYDVFSYTVTNPWVDHEWFSGVIFYFLENNWGDTGLLIFKVTLLFTILFLISCIIKLKNPKPDAHKNILFYFLLILALFITACHTVRCQLITFTLFTLWLYTLERVRLGETRLLWILPATMIFWANCHGGFVAGIGLLIMYGVGEFLNRKPCLKYFLTLIPTGLVTLINPYGFRYLVFIHMATTMKRPNITEWAKTDLLESVGEWYALKLVILVTIAAVIFNIIKNRKNLWALDKVKYIVTGVTLYLALSHIKLQAFFIITVAAFFYQDFYGIFRWIGNSIIQKTGEAGAKFLSVLAIFKNTLVYAVIIIGGGLLIKYSPLLIVVPTGKFPVGAIEYVKEHQLKGNLLTVFHWGSYAAWKLYPDCLIALDGRYEEVYPMRIFTDVVGFLSYTNVPERNIHWDDAINKYHTDIIIMGKTKKAQNAYNALLKTNNWNLLYEDKISALFVRKDYPTESKNFSFNPLTPTLDKYKTKLDFISD